MALLTAISFGSDEGWTSPLIVGLFLAAALLALCFLRHERRDTQPMLDLGLFRNRRFSAGIASGLGSYLVMFGVLLLVPFYLERGLGLGAARVGVELMVLPVCLGLVAPTAGRLADRVGVRRLTVSGMALVAGEPGLASACSGRAPAGSCSSWPPPGRVSASSPHPTTPPSWGRRPRSRRAWRRAS